MYNFVLSPIDPEKLIDSISERVTANILKVVNQTTPPTPPKEQLLTIQEAAEFLSLKVPTIYAMVSKGLIPVLKRSKRLYFSQTELIAYLKQGRKITLEQASTDVNTHFLTHKKRANYAR